MRGNYALVALSVFLGARGPFCAGALAFSPGAWRMAWRARARSRSCASAVGRRWIKGAVNERAPEDCGALRYYKRSLVKQMRREGKGWWVLKKLGGEIEVSNPRKRVKLAPAAASLVTFSFALLLSSSLLYAALFPGFSTPSSYASFYAEKSNAASPEGIIRALVGGGSSEVSSVDGNEPSSDVSASSALTFSSFFASAIQSTEATVSKTESVKTQNPSSDNPSSGGASGGSDQSGPSGGSPAGSEDSGGAASGSGGGATASGLTAAEENEFHAFLVDRFNQCVQLSGSLRESSGHLQYDAGLGDFGDAAQWYSDMLIYDNSIDSMKAELNRKIPVAERSRYRNFWSEIQYMVNDLGTMSAALVNQWGIAKQSGSASAVDTSATYASYRAHEDRARSLA